MTTTVSCGDPAVDSEYVLNATIGYPHQTADAEQCYCLLYLPVGTRWLSNQTVTFSPMNNGSTFQLFRRTLDRCDSLYTKNGQWPAGIKFLYTSTGGRGARPSLTLYFAGGEAVVDTLRSGRRYIITPSHANLRLSCAPDSFNLQVADGAVNTTSSTEDDCEDEEDDDGGYEFLYWMLGAFIPIIVICSICGQQRRRLVAIVEYYN